MYPRSAQVHRNGTADNIRPNAPADPIPSFQHNNITKAQPKKLPSRSEASHPSTDHHDPFVTL